MSIKRQRLYRIVTEEEICLFLDHVVQKKEKSAEIALLALLPLCDFDLERLDRLLQVRKVDFCFSKLNYVQMAPFVNLLPFLNFNDAGTFELHRSHIPTSLFKAILNGIGKMAGEFGPMSQHNSVKARFKFFSPIFNDLIPLFGMHVVNQPDPMVQGILKNRERIVDRFVCFGRVAIVFVQFDNKTTERLDALAQLIAEAYACDYANRRKNFHVPIYGILCDGEKFQIFKFFREWDPATIGEPTAETAPQNLEAAFENRFTNIEPVESDISSSSNQEGVSFLRGHLDGTSSYIVHDFADQSDCGRFIRSLRPICEIIFDLLLQSYDVSLEAHLKERQIWVKSHGGIPPNFEAHTHAKRALEMCREAHDHGDTKKWDECDTKAQAGKEMLATSVNLATLYNVKRIMDTYDEEFILQT